MNTEEEFKTLQEVKEKVNNELTPAQRYYRKHKTDLQKYAKEYYQKHKEERKEYYRKKNKEFYKNLPEEKKKAKNNKVKEWLKKNNGYMNAYNKDYSKDRYKKPEIIIKLAKEILNIDYTLEDIEKMPENEIKKLKKDIHNKRCKKFYHDNIDKYKEKIICDVCQKTFLRCNKSVHIKTIFHCIHQDIKDAIKRV